MKTPIFTSHDLAGRPVYVIDINDETTDIVAALRRNGTYVPNVEHVTFNTGMKTDKSHIDPKTGKKVIDAEHEVKTTILDFEDGTRSIVQCSANDDYSPDAGVVNAIVKRIGGIPDAKGTVDGAGTGLFITKLVKNAFDQQKEAAMAKEKKANAKAEHLARQKAEHEAAYAKKVAKLANSVQMIIDAMDKLGIKPADLAQKPTATKTVLNETVAETKAPKAKAPKAKHATKIKDMTPDQKRAYWRAANARRSAKNK